MLQRDAAARSRAVGAKGACRLQLLVRDLGLVAAHLQEQGR